MGPSCKLFEIETKSLPSGTFGFESKCGKTGYGGWLQPPQRVPRNSCSQAYFHTLLLLLQSAMLWYGVHTYLAKAMTTFMESDSTANYEKGTHAIIMSGKVSFS